MESLRRKIRRLLPTESGRRSMTSATRKAFRQMLILRQQQLQWESLPSGREFKVVNTWMGTPTAAHYHHHQPAMTSLDTWMRTHIAERHHHYQPAISVLD